MEHSIDPAFQRALNFLYSFVDYERNPGWSYDARHFDLSRMRELLAFLGNPQDNGRSVHLTGTNGKGSVAAMISNSLVCGGYKTGLYTSPHLYTLRERIRINGHIIPEQDVIAGVERLREFTGEIDRLTFFEVWTSLAFDYFGREKVDASVIEVGMGGKLDSTNIITPAVSVFTSISSDHRGKLGNTLAEIATEKAGIIKPDQPVVTAPQTPEVMQVLENKARETNSQLIVVGRDVRYGIVDDGISYSGLKCHLDFVRVPLHGTVQRENAAVALAVLESLSRLGLHITPDKAKQGIETVRWPGRLQVIPGSPEIVLDGACNISAMEVVNSYLQTRNDRDKIVAVVGICVDKDVGEVISLLAEKVSGFVLTQVNNPRAASVDELARYVPDGFPFETEPDPETAVKKAEKMAGKNGLVLVTGSLYLVGDILKIIDYKCVEDI